MQIHTPADQLLSPVKTERPGGGARSLYQPICIQSHTEDVSALLLYVLPLQVQHMSVQVPMRRPDSGTTPVLEGKASRPPLQTSVGSQGKPYSPGGHHVQCGCCSSPAWFEPTHCQDRELKKTATVVVHLKSQRDAGRRLCHVTLYLCSFTSLKV